MNTVEYVLDKLSNHDMRLHAVRRLVANNRKRNKLINVYILLNTTIIVLNDLEKRMMQNDINMLKREIEKLKRSKGE